MSSEANQELEQADGEKTAYVIRLEPALSIPHVAFPRAWGKERARATESAYLPPPHFQSLHLLLDPDDPGNLS
ncbi:hypothetical protein ASPFODRAFT_207762 [Aspergillus luchuensis CBS 106.47]|uniref:Uncharacterized protein n=1 Tax=Aspergillus luchuensis (strain CBS 106.47) TaxID=1137211 RepID=A0A1M3TGT5_ASPLC|nr:hypothetical protein ASPFODRAFT_207762 [Aspergillus luchuensis CBS 106.47]